LGLGELVFGTESERNLRFQTDGGVRCQMAGGVMDLRGFICGRIAEGDGICLLLQVSGFLWGFTKG
jgi:hypothetical protein